MRIFARTLVAGVLAVPLLLGGTAPASADIGHHDRAGAVRVGGAVDAGGTLTRADLATLPQTTLVDERSHGGRHELTGVLLQTVVDDAEPQLPDAKNAALRVSITVSGRHRSRVPTAWGELDAGFGNHPALLVLSRDGHRVGHAPELAFPGDANRARTVHDVRRISVAVAAADSADVAAGSVVVRTARGSVTLSGERLARLPQRTLSVSFQAGQGPQTHVETGPSLAAVLRAARVQAGPATSVAASATDGYVAVVTTGEQTSGKRPLLLSLAEDGQPLTRPRLVPDGDVRGGRYVTDVTTLTVTRPGHR